MRSLISSLERKKADFLEHDEMFKVQLTVAALERLHRVEFFLFFFTVRRAKV